MATSTLPFADVSDQANKFMTGQAIAPYLANLPNYANMVGQRTENIGQQLKGQLPQDVINQIGQQAAERGISSGSPGSPNANAAYLRALGLNSLQMQQQGNQNLTGAIADTPVPQLFNPMSLAVPQMNAQQEMTSARLGRASGARQNPWGVQTAGVAGMPNLSAGHGTPFSPDAASFGASVSGPSWGTGGGGGMFNSPSFTGGMWNGNGAFTGGGLPTGGGGSAFQTADFDPNAYTYASGGQYGGSVDWSSLFHDPNMPAGWSDQSWGGPFNQIDASNPENAFMFE